jgi:phage tail sheath protein FI
VGHIAGTYVRTDNALPGGVYRAPAGVEYGQLLGATGLENEDVLNEATRDYVAPRRINPITTYQGAPIFIDGHDTLKGDGNFPTVPERRGAIYIEQTIKRGMESFRHAPNDAQTRAEVEQTIRAFLIEQMRVRAFRTGDPDTAFSVDAGEGVNPPTDQFAGKLNVRVALATNRPNKWIILVFSQDVRAIQEELASS